LLRLLEKYLAQLGERRGMLLLATILIWVSILLALVAYAAGAGALMVGRVSVNAYRAIVEIVTDRAYGGDPWAIFLGAVVWIVLLLSIFPLRALAWVMREGRLQEVRAQKALSGVEERLFPRDRRTSSAEPARERLARRALDEIETELRGEPQPADLTIEERLVRLQGD
jgi:hypothetical protein